MAAAAEVHLTVQALTARLHKLVAQAGDRAAALWRSPWTALPLPCHSMLSDQDFAAASDDEGGASPWLASPRPASSRRASRARHGPD